MGAYLSEPKTDKISTDEANNRLAWGTSSMQGWRITQEDAHNCITDYDENTSYFAVYDGHGGAEVATYCALKLPDFIKQTEAYKNGDMSQALIDGYLGFDGTIINKEVIEKLKELAGKKQNTDIEEEDGEDNLLSLKKEALTPLEQIMAKYRQKGLNIPRIVRVDEGDPSSVSVPSKGKGKKSNCEDAAGGSGQTDSPKASSAGKSDVSDGVSSSTTEGNKPGTSGDTQVSTSNGETSKVASSSMKNSDDAVTESTSKTSENSLPDSSNDNCAKPATSDSKVTSPDDSPVTPTTSDDAKNVTDSKSAKEVTQSNDEVTCNGEVVESTKSGDKVSSSSQEAEVATKNASNKGKGKAKAVVSSSDSPEKTDDKESPSKRTKRAAALYNNLLISSEDDEDSDSNDETFEGQDAASSSDETEMNGIENGSSGDDDEDDDDVEAEEDSSEEEEEEDEDCEDYDDINLTGSDEPGMDSGCTAVVAILKGDQLYVANAGDSRCVVCRDGQAVDMSLDHKPEDALELARVEKAGGKVNGDGRINGGLNLSRAIGDHSYKQNKDLDDKEQMITALPDIKTLTINPETDHFMVLACDGIWNFMTSQEVIDFVGERLKDESKSLSAICEELFDKCMAPTTLGDGTGCDNMTAIVIKFKKSPESAASDIPVESSKKRLVDDTEESAPKRQKTDDESVMSAAVTSSE